MGKRRGTVALVAGALLLVALGAPGPAAAQAAPTDLEIVLAGEGNRLHAYDAISGAERVLIPSSADDPAGLDINAEICMVPEGVPWKPAGEVWFIAGEDTEQNAAPGVLRQGWGLFRLEGASFDTLIATEVGKLVPDSFATTADNPENYGCGVLPDGRIVTGDVGDQFPQDPATGQLIAWYPVADHFRGPVGPGRTDFAPVPHCKIDATLATAGGILVDGTDVLIATNRPNLETLELGGIYRFDTTTWPTGETPADGCGRTDTTGEQLASADRVGKSLFIPQLPPLVTTPSDIAASGHGTYYVSSVLTGQVAEFGRDGVFRRFVLLDTGIAGGITPFGIGVTRDGTLWIADIGARTPEPVDGEGSVVRVRFDGAGNPLPPEVIDDGLDFPDGIGVVVLPLAAAAPVTTPVAVDTGGGTLPATGTEAPLAAALVAGMLAVAVLRRIPLSACGRW
jgi:hypothetical protein